MRTLLNSERGCGLTWWFPLLVIFALCGRVAGQAPGVGQIQRLADHPDHRFGASLARSGSVLAIGEPGYNSSDGAVSIFHRNPSTGLWAFDARVTAVDFFSPGRAFGHTVAVSGGRMAVGAPQDGFFAPWAGAVYVFEREGGGWVQRAKLMPDGGFASFSQMGWTLAMEGNVIATGRPDRAVRIFEGSGGSWTQTAGLWPADAVDGDRFGESLAMSGNTLAVGAVGDDPQAPGAPDFTGSVSIYQRQADASWTLQAKLVASDAAAGAFFGNSVDLQGDVCVVGAGHGRTYVFERVGGVWSETARLAPSGVTAFGHQVALDGDALVVSDPEDAQQGTSAGALHVYRKTGGVWTAQAVLRAADGRDANTMGVALAHGGGQVAAGALAGGPNGMETGAVYVFQVPTQIANSPPTGLALSHRKVAEQQPAGTVVGHFTATDPDAGDVFAYALVAGAGGADNGRFTIVDGELRTLGPIDFAVTPQLAVRVRVEDRAGEAYEEAFVIDVMDLDRPVTITLQGLLHDYDGSPKSAVVVTDPPGLAHEVRYAAATSAPVLPGSYGVTATLSEPGYFPMVANGTLLIRKLPQVITFPQPADRSLDDPASWEHHAVASSGLAVEFSSSDSGVAEADAIEIYAIGAGTVTLTASQPGNEIHDAAVPVSRTFTIRKRLQTATMVEWPELFVTNTNAGWYTSDQGYELEVVPDDPTLWDASPRTWTGSGVTMVTLGNAGDDSYEPLSLRFPARVFSRNLLWQRFDSGLYVNQLAAHEAIAAEGDVMCLTRRGNSGMLATAHVFERGPDCRWREVCEVRPQRRSGGAVSGDGFGKSLAVSAGGAVAVAVPMPPDQTTSGIFGVAVWERRGGRWMETGELRIPGPMTGMPQAGGLDFAGETLFAGVPSVGVGGGVVVVFDRDADGSWMETGRLKSGDDAPNFGAVVAADGDWLAVGGDAVAGGGRVAMFQRQAAGGWQASGVIALAAMPARLDLNGGRLVGWVNGATRIWEPDAGGQWQATADFQGLGPNAGIGGEVMVAGDPSGRPMVHRRRSDGSWLRMEPLDVNLSLTGLPLLVAGDSVVSVATYLGSENWGRLPTVSCFSVKLGRDASFSPPTAIVGPSTAFPAGQPGGTLVGEVTATGGSLDACGHLIFDQQDPLAVVHHRWLSLPSRAAGSDTPFSIQLRAANRGRAQVQQTIDITRGAAVDAVWQTGAPVAAGGQRFGETLAASGKWLVVGSQAGRVEVYGRSGATWAHAGSLTSPVAGSGVVPQFGRSLAVWADRVAVGAPRDGDHPSDLNGRVRIFEPDGAGVWGVKAVIESPRPRHLAGFGEAVAMSGDHLLVTAPGHPGTSGTGTAWVFRRDRSGAWVLEAELDRTPLPMIHGVSCALHGEWAVVGGNSFAVIYRRGPGGVWSRVNIVRDWSFLATGMVNQNFGSTVAMNDRHLLVGGTPIAGDPVFAFERLVEDTWLATGWLARGSGGNLPGGLALRGDRGLVGPQLFLRVDRDVWLHEREVQFGTQPLALEYGRAVALAGGQLVVSDPSHAGSSYNEGRVYVLDPIGAGPGVSAPTLILLDQDAIGDDAAVGTVVGRLRAVDADVDDTFAFELTPCAPDNDNSQFRLDGAFLRTAARLDVKGGGLQLMHVRLRVTDSQGHNYEQTQAVVVRDVTDWSPDLEWVGVDRFHYSDGPIAGESGGFGFDFDNTTGNGPWIGHTGTSSLWKADFGNPMVAQWCLVTAESSASRNFNGPGTGSTICDDEVSGAFTTSAIRAHRTLYFRVLMKRGADTGFSGVSGLVLGQGTFFAGVISTPNPASGSREFGIATLDANDQWTARYSGKLPVAGRWDSMVVKVDFVNSMMSFWLDPQIAAGEAGQPPLLQIPYPAARFGLTALQLHSGSGAAVEWDDLVIATEWKGLGVNDGVFPFARSLGAWLAQHGLPPSAGNEGDDLNGDGISLLLGWALGIDPLKGLSAGQSGVMPTAGPPVGQGMAPRFFFSLPNDLPPINYILEATDVLGSGQWSELARLPAGGSWQVTGNCEMTSSPEGPHRRRYEVRLPNPPATQPCLFLRLRVTTGALPP